MIRDAKGRKWFMRFERYQQGWHWRARSAEHNIGAEAAYPVRGCRVEFKYFKTKALAEADARRYLQSNDLIGVIRRGARRSK